ncbi:MAG TPA: sulfotransferase family protein [Gammaproteobacteria bacterium]|nr:sulfotransferase family protein [Gammaproteobacteria bacterium]
MHTTTPDRNGKPFQRYPEFTYFYNPRYRFLYAPVPKSACSSLKVIMYRLQLLDQPDLPAFLPRDYDGRSFHVFMDSNYTLSRQSAENADAILQSPDVFRFTFVRHPLDRIASAYLNKFVNERYNSEQWEHTLPATSAVLGRQSRPVVDSITFRQFVTYIAGTPDTGLDKHWRSQDSFLAAGIDFHIGHVENFAEDLGHFARQLCLPVDTTHANRTARGHTRLPDRPYWEMSPDQLRRLPTLPANRQMYNPELEQSVRDRYLTDFERFSYHD